MKVIVEHHVCELDPPNERRLFWLVACSYGDLTQSYRNKVEALTVIYNHFLDLTLKEALESGEYVFDDSGIPTDSITDRMREVLQQPLQVVDIRGYFI
jgi:hypothetical protein